MLFGSSGFISTTFVQEKFKKTGFGFGPVEHNYNAEYCFIIIMKQYTSCIVS